MLGGLPFIFEALGSSPSRRENPLNKLGNLWFVCALLCFAYVCVCGVCVYLHVCLLAAAYAHVHMCVKARGECQVTFSVTLH